MSLELQILAALPTDLQGDQWEVIFVQEGDFVDGKHHITRAALEQAQATGMFENVYVQELHFKDGTTRHLPSHLANEASGGVFGNAVAITRNTAFKILNSGKAAIVGMLEAIDDSWKTKMRNIAIKGLKLPGLSFNALAAFADRMDAGKAIRDIINFTRIDTFEIVSYPNAGGQILRCVASEDIPGDAPQHQHTDVKPQTSSDRTRTVMDKTALIKLLSARGLPFGNVDGTPEDMLAEVMKSKEFEALDANAKALFAALQDAMVAKADTVVEKLVMALMVVNQPKKEESIIPPAKEDNAEAVIPNQIQAGLDTEAVLRRFEQRLEKQLADKTRTWEETLKARQAEQDRVIAAQDLVNKSTIPDALKPQVFQAIKGDINPKAALEGWVKAIAPLSEAGKVQASTSHLRGISMGLDTKDKQTIGLTKLVGGRPSDTEKSDWQQVPAFRSLGHAFTTITGIDAYNMTLEEFTNPERIRADIDMFQVASFPKLLGNTLNRAVVDIYNEQPHMWNDFAIQRKGVKDFKALRMNRIGGFGVPLPEYADTGTGQTTRYTGGITLVAPPSEQEGNYSVKIRASQWLLTYQALRDDDIGALNSWLRKFAESCDDTALYLVMQQVINYSGTINGGVLTQDSKALYHADHANIMTDELSYEALRDACKKIRMQTDGLGSSKPLNLQPFGLLIPESLRDVGEVIVGAEKRPMDSSNDPNTMSFLKMYCLHDFWLGNSAKNWYVFGDPKRESSAFVEVGFLDDKSTPTILTSNDPTNDLMFTHLRTAFSGIFIMGSGTRCYESVVGSFPA